ncbi:uncharacterized protein PHALS_03051 [Plasmopara halstedii]|uniref:Uncharacterized protein n=1 Tax=Plasmopara halstedii TaxID=4781 RepID=A0A0P1A7U0_PLAHL|nr:uncharacterized protein PHALS_03051 [Plasmopara halstedii]CEG36503.1 hypothetical protein PHALS_03051 [Plasmopara halstedii]|eukprot:XP_024572872.1 hypothetical protein PHALS_03051 [Plasmopara halstedii]
MKALLYKQPSAFARDWLSYKLTPHNTRLLKVNSSNGVQTVQLKKDCYYRITNLDLLFGSLVIVSFYLCASLRMLNVGHQIVLTSPYLAIKRNDNATSVLLLQSS